MIRITLLCLFKLSLAVATAVWTCGCAGTEIGSVGIHGAYIDEQKRTFEGGVDIGLRDSKTIKPLKR